MIPLFRRREFLALATASLTPRLARPDRASGSLPVTGVVHADLAPFNRLMTSFVETNGVPGAALAVTRRSRLVYARGFGFADVQGKQPVEPAALFRIASVSKPLTAVAVMHLIERGKLSLDDKVVARAGLALPAHADARWGRVTVRQCLQHTGGWDRDRSFDPIGRPWVIAKALGTKPPVAPAEVVRYMLGQPLDFDPGERYAYSNLGYLVLARVLEAVAESKYEEYVRKEVLAPLGIHRMRLGRALPEHRAQGEVHYYDAKKRTGRCLYPLHQGQTVPLQYGAENFEGFEAHGGWIASAVDLARFAAAFDDPARCPVLKPRTIATMWARPAGAAGHERDGKPRAAYYGCGWEVRPVGDRGKVNVWHAGFIAGTEALLVRRWDGLNWAVVFNAAQNPKGESLTGLIDGAIHDAADQVRRWPDRDLFGKYLG